MFTNLLRLQPVTQIIKVSGKRYEQKYGKVGMVSSLDTHPEQRNAYHGPENIFFFRSHQSLLSWTIGLPCSLL